jgi:hypothetical protein
MIPETVFDCAWSLSSPIAYARRVAGWRKFRNCPLVQERDKTRTCTFGTAGQTSENASMEGPVQDAKYSRPWCEGGGGISDLKLEISEERKEKAQGLKAFTWVVWKGVRPANQPHTHFRSSATQRDKLVASLASSGNISSEACTVSGVTGSTLVGWPASFRVARIC